MSKKVFVILWLTLSFSPLALALDEKKKGPCWEETRPEDPVGCHAQLEKTILRAKAERTPLNKKQIDLEVRLLEVDKKKLEKLLKEKTVVTRRAVQRQEREAQAESNADISCPEGKIQIVKMFNAGHFVYNRFQAFNRVVVINPLPFTILISAIDPNRNKSGKIMELPPGCSATLSRSIVPFLETGNGGVRFSYIAQPVDVADGGGKIARSQEFYLFGGNSYQQMNTSVWEVRFW